MVDDKKVQWVHEAQKIQQQVQNAQRLVAEAKRLLQEGANV